MKIKINFKYLIIFIISFSILNSCKKDAQSSSLQQIGCDTTNTLFSQLYKSVVNTSPNKNDTTMDAETHSYTFEVSSPSKICKIGYQSLPTFNTTKYLIEIYNNTTNMLVYSGSHNFSPTNTSYVSISPLTLVVGNSYTIKRIQKNWGSNIGNTIGRLVRNPNSLSLTFPVTKGILKITSTSFYGTTVNPINDFGIPFIDIVFE